MSAEGNLYNPSVFLPLNRTEASSYRSGIPASLQASLSAIDEKYPSSCQGREAFIPIPQMSEQYLAIVQSLKTQIAISAIKSHLFRLWKPVFGNNGRHTDLRDALGKITGLQTQAQQGENWLAPFFELTKELRKRLEVRFQTCSPASWKIS